MNVAMHGLDVAAHAARGLAQRLNVTQTPCVAYIRGNQLVGCVNCGDICPTNIDALVNR